MSRSLPLPKCPDHSLHQDLFNSLPLGVLFHDAAGRITAANPAALAILGVGPRDILGTSLLDARWHPLRKDGTPLPADQCPVSRGLRAGQPVKNQVVGLFNAAENGYRWLNLSAVPLARDGRIDRLYTYFEDISERREAERARRKTDERLRFAHAAAGVGLWEWNPMTNEILWSPEVEVLYGLAPGGYPRRLEDWLALLHPEDRPRVERLTREMDETLPSFEVEFRVRRPDGEIRWLVSRGRSEWSPGSGLQRVMGINLDITWRKQAEVALRESEARYRSLVEASPDAIFVSDGYRINLVNPACLELVGASAPADLLGKPTLDLFHPDDHPLILPRRQRALEQGLANPLVEVRMIRLDGQILDVEAVSAPFDHAGRRAVHVVLRDIRERKRRETERERLHRLQRVIDQGNRALLKAASQEDYLQDVCRVIQESCGHPTVWIGLAEWDTAHSIRRVALAGRAPPDLDLIPFTWADTEWGQGPTGTAIRTGQPNVCRVTEPRAGPWRAIAQAHGYASAAALPLLDPEGRTLGNLTLYSSDPQAFNPDEVQLLGVLANDLAMGIRGLRLRAAHDQAEAAMGVLRQRMQEVLEWQVASQTAAGIAHELNQPLNAITTFGDAALRLLANLGDPSPPLVKAVAGMIIQAERAGHVLRQLLGFLRRTDTTLEGFDLNGLAQEALSLARTEGCPAGRVKLELAPGLRPVLGNRLQIEKVFLNLLRNSLEAVAETDLERTLRIRLRVAMVGDHAQVSLADNGPGLDEATAARVFEPFFTTKSKGIGMGLAISRALVEAHGGQLWYTPTPGGGASFHFTLPFVP